MPFESGLCEYRILSENMNTDAFQLISISLQTDSVKFDSLNLDYFIQKKLTFSRLYKSFIIILETMHLN